MAFLTCALGQGWKEIQRIRFWRYWGIFREGQKKRWQK